MVYAKALSVRLSLCKTDTLLLQTTNRKSHMAFQTAAILMTFSDVQGE